MTALTDLVFTNGFTAELPADPDTDNRRREVRGALFSRVAPTPVKAPRVVAASSECAELIGLDPAELGTEDFARVFGGNALVPGMDPYAMTYGGHQFGHWAGQLGDGRAINLGEIEGPEGPRPWTLQLKGAGPTPYSRSADGLAVLRSSVREFLCSEAMHHLGVPTTRALSLVSTGEQVLRDMFYDGNQKYEPGAVVCRVARSFVRFGASSSLTSRGEEGSSASSPITSSAATTPSSARRPRRADPQEIYVAWLEELRDRTARMIAHWSRVGFVHGVMNTDNMSIRETIDYGPYGWLEDYDPDWTPNTTDAQGKRYRFGHQAAIGHWNLTRLASAVAPLLGETEPLQALVDGYPEVYAAEWGAMLAAKLGFELRGDLDAPLAAELFRVLGSAETDMTIFFRRLADVTAETEDPFLALRDAYYAPDEVNDEVRGRWRRGPPPTSPAPSSAASRTRRAASA